MQLEILKLKSDQLKQKFSWGNPGHALPLLPSTPDTRYVLQMVDLRVNIMIRILVGAYVHARGKMLPTLRVQNWRMHRLIRIPRVWNHSHLKRHPWVEIMLAPPDNMLPHQENMQPQHKIMLSSQKIMLPHLETMPLMEIILPHQMNMLPHQENMLPHQNMLPHHEIMPLPRRPCFPGEVAWTPDEVTWCWSPMNSLRC